MEDLGDEVGYPEGESRSTQFGLNFLRMTRPLEPGHVITIEPGIYFEDRMAVRTEIDVFITPAGSVEVCGPIQKDLILIG